jgi:hypothetical protein
VTQFTQCTQDDCQRRQQRSLRGAAAN